MAKESFEDEETAEILNQNFISIKVDKEERPDIDSIYMAVCLAFTGSGGWPTSIFMTSEQKPFYAGTYFPKKPRFGMICFSDLLYSISDKWKNNKKALLDASEEIISYLNKDTKKVCDPSEDLINHAISYYKQAFDKDFGGFGTAPKFPCPHNLLFLMDYYEESNDTNVLNMVEKTLLQMYRGGIFDHIGFGFSRYSTDQYFLVPHFEKMLCDNALLMISYTKAFYFTQKNIYKTVAEKTADFILRELTDTNGGFYSAQDADSDGIEGKYYTFDYYELIHVLGQGIGSQFNAYYGIVKQGNFEGKNIPNLLNSTDFDDRFEKYRAKVYLYRKFRTNLSLDDKILTSWNSLMISAFALMYRVFDKTGYLEAAKKADNFIEEHLCENNTLYVSCRSGVKSKKGFLDDYAFYIYALLNLYEATLDNSYLVKAKRFCDKTIIDFYDTEHFGFYLYGKEHESLIIKPKETYDGAIPCGNSVMAYNLIKLVHIIQDPVLEKIAKEQVQFMSSAAKDHPAGCSFYLTALLIHLNPSENIVCVLKNKSDINQLKGKIKLGTNIRILETPTAEYQLLNDKTTFYVCNNQRCLPPTNQY